MKIIPLFPSCLCCLFVVFMLSLTSFTWAWICSCPKPTLHSCLFQSISNETLPFGFTLPCYLSAHFCTRLFRKLRSVRCMIRCDSSFGPWCQQIRFGKVYCCLLNKGTAPNSVHPTHLPIPCVHWCVLFRCCKFWNQNSFPGKGYKYWLDAG